VSDTSLLLFIILSQSQKEVIMSVAGFNKAITHHYHSLKPFAISLTQNNVDAEDLVQDTMFRALKYQEKFTHNTNLKAWLLIMMRNIFINNHRKKNVRKTQAVDTNESMYLFDNQTSVRNLALSQLVVDDINRALQKLPKEYKKIFIMYCEGYKYQEIADYMTVPLGTIKSRIHWIRKNLQEALANYKFK